MINKKYFIVISVFVFFIGIVLYQEMSFSSTELTDSRTTVKANRSAASALPNISYAHGQNQRLKEEESSQTPVVQQTEENEGVDTNAVEDNNYTSDENSINSLVSSGESNHFYKRLEGTIGDQLGVTMHLVKVDNQLSGNYVYNHVGKTIKFDAESRIDEERKLILREFEFNKHGLPKITGIFKGKMITNHWIKGAWIKPDSSLNMPFSLRENYQTSSNRLWIEQRSRTEGVCENEQCVSINLVYPQLIEGDEEQQRAIDRINQRIERTVSKHLSPSKKQQNEAELNTIIDNLVAEYEQTLENATGEVGNWRWEYEVKPNIFSNTYDLLSLGLAFYTYTGGTEDKSHYQGLNFDLMTGRQVALMDVLTDKYHYKLNRKVLRQLKKTLGLAAHEDLEENDFFISDEDFKLTNNYCFSKGGITFFYNPNEIADRSYGTFEVFLPFIEIENLIKKDGLLGEFVKR